MGEPREPLPRLSWEEDVAALLGGWALGKNLHECAKDPKWKKGSPEVQDELSKLCRQLECQPIVWPTLCTDGTSSDPYVLRLQERQLDLASLHRKLKGLRNTLALCTPELRGPLHELVDTNYAGIIGQCRTINELLCKMMAAARRLNVPLGVIDGDTAQKIMHDLQSLVPSVPLPMWRCHEIRYLGNAYLHPDLMPDRIRTHLIDPEAEPTMCIVAVRFLLHVLESFQAWYFEPTALSTKASTAADKATKKHKKRSCATGFHLYINHPDLQTLWRKHVAPVNNNKEDVSWKIWWQLFPSQLPEAERDEVQRLLPPGDKLAQKVFRAAVQPTLQAHSASLPGKPTQEANLPPLTYKDLQQAFPADQSLGERIEELLQSTCTLPRNSSNYIGRDRVAEDLAARLSGSDVHAVLLRGEGGMGKSELAKDVGRRLKTSVNGLTPRVPGHAVWVDLRGACTKELQCARFCDCDALDLEQTSQDALLKWLEELKQPTLLILDNAEDGFTGQDAADFADLLYKIMKASLQVRLLITSQSSWSALDKLQQPTAGWCEEVEVPKLEDDHLLQLLHKLCHEVHSDRLTQAEQLVEVVHGSPLLLGLVASALLNGKDEQDILDEAARTGGAITLPWLLAACTPLQQSQLIRLRVFPGAFKEQEAMAIISDRRKAVQEQQDAAQKALQQFRAHGLLSFSNGAYTVHSSISAAAASLPGADGKLYKGAAAAFVQLMHSRLCSWAEGTRGGAGAPEGEQREAGAEQREAKDRQTQAAGEQTEAEGGRSVVLQAASQQWLNLTEMCQLLYSECPIVQLQPLGVVPGNQALLEELASQLDEAGLFAAAVPVHRHSYGLAQHIWPSRHVVNINSLEALSHCLLLAGHTQEAHTKAEQAVQLCQSAPEGQHPLTWRTLRALADCLIIMGRLDEALVRREQALQLCLDTLGDWHQDTISSLNDLATCLQGMDRLDEACKQHRRALQLCQDTCSEQHPATITCISKLAGCLQEMGRLDEACAQHERALLLCQDTLDGQHQLTIRSLGNLASCLQAMGRLDAACDMYEQVLQLHQVTLGGQHPQTTHSISNLASCLEAMGRLDEACDMYEQVLQLRQVSLGGRHPRTIHSLSNLASCLQEMGRLDEACAQHERALQLCQDTLVGQHPVTIAFTSKLAGCLQAMGRLNEACIKHTRVLQLRQDTLGPRHPGTIISHNNLASCLQAMGRVDDAHAQYEQGLRLCLAASGVEDPDIFRSHSDLASCLQAMEEVCTMHEQTFSDAGVSSSASSSSSDATHTGGSGVPSAVFTPEVAAEVASLNEAQCLQGKTLGDAARCSSAAPGGSDTPSANVTPEVSTCATVIHKQPCVFQKWHQKARPAALPPRFSSEAELEKYLSTTIKPMATKNLVRGIRSKMRHENEGGSSQASKSDYSLLAEQIMQETGGDLIAAGNWLEQHRDLES